MALKVTRQKKDKSCNFCVGANTEQKFYNVVGMHRTLNVSICKSCIIELFKRTCNTRL